MKALRLILTALALTLLMAGCTQNNGDISPWFGYWRVESITLDGTPDAAYAGGMTWSFQNNIIDITTPTDPHHSYSKVWGTWAADEAERTLTVDFTHWRDQGDEAYAYLAPAVLQINPDEPAVYSIESRKGRVTVLGRMLPDGRRQSITLNKAY